MKSILNFFEAYLKELWELPVGKGCTKMLETEFIQETLDIKVFVLKLSKWIEIFANWH